MGIAREQEPIIRIQNVSFTYANQEIPSLDHVSLDIFPGSITLLCGPTGSGKTTLIRLFNALIPHFHEGYLEGTVLVSGQDTRKTTTARLAQTVGMVFQDPENQLVSSSCEREIAFGPENLGLPREEIKNRVERTMALLGIEDLREKSPQDLSGGQKQKVVIAAALALQPEVLVFDEPSSNLDPAATLQLVKIIKQLHKKLNTTFVIIEHRLEFFLNIATHLVCMEAGKIALQGEVQEVVNDPRFYELGIQVPVILKIFKRLRAIKEDVHVPLDQREGIIALEKMLTR